MGTDQHPVRKLQKWVKPERVSGIAQSSTVALKGAVSLRVKMLKAGSEAEGVDDAPQLPHDSDALLDPLALLELIELPPSCPLSSSI